MPLMVGLFVAVGFAAAIFAPLLASSYERDSKMSQTDAWASMALVVINLVCLGWLAWL